MVGTRAAGSGEGYVGNRLRRGDYKAVAVLTEWKEFLDTKLLNNLKKCNPIFFDGRNIFKKNDFLKLFSLGK